MAIENVTFKISDGAVAHFPYIVDTLGCPRRESVGAQQCRLADDYWRLNVANVVAGAGCIGDDKSHIGGAGFLECLCELKVVDAHVDRIKVR